MASAGGGDGGAPEGGGGVESMARSPRRCCWPGVAEGRRWLDEDAATGTDWGRIEAAFARPRSVEVWAGESGPWASREPFGRCAPWLSERVGLWEESVVEVTVRCPFRLAFPDTMRFLLLSMAEAVVDGGAQETRRPDRVRAGGWLLPLVAPRLELQAFEPESAEDKDVAEKHPFPDTP